MCTHVLAFPFLIGYWMASLIKSLVRCIFTCHGSEIFIFLRLIRYVLPRSLKKWRCKVVNLGNWIQPWGPIASVGSRAARLFEDIKQFARTKHKSSNANLPSIFRILSFVNKQFITNLFYYLSSLKSSLLMVSMISVNYIY